MTEDRSDPQGPDAFASASSSHEPSGDEPPFFGDDTPPMGDQASVALDVARLWVREHQTTTMLGAFAVGVFVGALFRE